MAIKKMNPSSQTHKAIALISLVILSYLQFNLIYNTYELKNNEYVLKESQVIKNAYEKAIRNDKVYPGGQKIVDRFIYRNLSTLEDTYHNNPAAFALLKQKICDSIIRELRLNSNMDSTFKAILEKNHLDSHFNYLLTVNDMAVTFNGTDYVSLYKPGKKKLPYLNPAIQNEYGIIIDGQLKSPMNQNLVSAILVSSPLPGSYYLSFALYVDHDNRKITILKSMSFTLLLSVSFILMVICIYYFTYRNWLKQKKLSDMKSDFLNSITHEFNTPITTILVANTSIQNKEIIDNKLKIYPLTDVIKRQAQRLQTLVNQALDISQMNKDTIEMEIYDIGSLLEEVINDYKLKITEDASITYNLENVHCLVLLNRFLLTTMLYNIFDNALKHNTQVSKKIQIEVTEKDQSLTICIIDNGVGLNKKLMKLIFDKFYRGKNGIETRGLGLGLFYVKQTLEAHSWKLNLLSELGQGSTFCITMPIEKEK